VRSGSSAGQLPPRVQVNSPDGSSGRSGSSGSSSGSSGGSRQAVAEEAVRGAGGGLQSGALGLSTAATAVGEEGGGAAVGTVVGWLVQGVLGVAVLQGLKMGVEVTMQQVGLGAWVL
jgi:hypothetical protein